MDTKKLRQKILDLAIRGKLVPQDPNDEPASVLLERIRAEKERLIAEGKIKRTKKSKASSAESHYQQFTPPFSIPESWEWVRLEEITSKIGSGSTPKGSNYSVEGIPFFRSQNIYNHGLVYDDIKYISNVIHKSMSGTIVHPKDLLLNITGGSIGRCAIVPSDFNEGNVSQHVCIIRPVLVNSEYLHCYIISDLFWSSMRLTGSGREGLPKYNLEQMLLPLPPLKEQEKIICSLKKYLDTISEIENSQESLSNYIANAKSKILELAMQGQLVPQDPTDEPAADMLLRINPKAKIITDNPHSWNIPSSWTWCYIGDIFQHNTGKALNSSNKDGIDYEYITTSNVYWGRFVLGDLNKMPFKENEIGKCTVSKGDLLVCEGGDVGRAAIWNLERNIMIQNHLHRLRALTNEICTALYFHVFRLYKDRDLIGSKGIALQGFSSKSLHHLIVPLPPSNEQKRIAIQIEDLYSTLDEIETSLQS